MKKGDYKIKKLNGKDFSILKLRPKMLCGTTIVGWLFMQKSMMLQMKENKRQMKKGDSLSSVPFLIEVLRKIKGKSAFEIWSNLLKKHEERNAQGINFLRMKFLNEKQEKSESFENFIKNNDQN